MKYRNISKVDLYKFINNNFISWLNKEPIKISLNKYIYRSYCIDCKLIGKTRAEFDHYCSTLIVLFEFNCAYLNIKDILFIEQREIFTNEDLINKIDTKLGEIKTNFKAYFNKIWC